MNEINDFITKNYKSMTAKELANELGITLYAVQSRVNSLGLKKGNRKYTCNLDFFKIPNILNSYWAGFLAADGNIRNDLSQINLFLSSKDKSHIDKFVSDIGYNGPIKNRISKEKYHISGVDLCGATKNIQYLKDNFNIIANKSLVLIPPNLKSITLTKAFIKGLIDGDGTIIVSKNGRLEFSIVGTKEILEFVKNVFDNIVPSKTKKSPSVRQRKDKTSNNHYTYKVTGFRAYEILTIFKSVKTPEIERKWKNLELCVKPIYKSRYSASTIEEAVSL